MFFTLPSGWRRVRKCSGISVTPHQAARRHCRSEQPLAGCTRLIDPGESSRPEGAVLPAAPRRPARACRAEREQGNRLSRWERQAGGPGLSEVDGWRSLGEEDPLHQAEWMLLVPAEPSPRNGSLGYFLPNPRGLRVQKAVAEKGLQGGEWRMTQQGAVLQGYNNELVKCIEDLCMQKEELNKQIQQAEEERNKLQHDIQVLSEKLECVSENLAQKIASRNELDKILAETEAAYMKILDSSRTLLNVLKKEVGSLKHTPELKTNVTDKSLDSTVLKFH